MISSNQGNKENANNSIRDVLIDGELQNNTSTDYVKATDKGNEEFCRALPKCELHAHLNGSLSTATMRRLLALHRSSYPGELSNHKRLHEYIQKNQTMEGFDFAIFDVVRSLTDTPAAVAMATRDVIRDFEADGVRYLELRSTPRIVAGRMTKHEYCEAIVKQIISSTVSTKLQDEKGVERDGDLSSGIVVKFLLSIDRRKIDEFEENVQLWWSLKDKYPQIMAGLDISGDPRVGNIADLIPRLLELRERGVKVTVHLSEIANEEETMSVLGYRPDRVGHCTFIHPATGGTTPQLEALRASKAPVEVCLTSNVLCKTSPSYKLHHARYLHNAGVTVMISTDDKGVFKCSLSSEYNLAMENFDWSRNTMFELSRQAIEYIFAGDSLKEKLRREWDEWKSQNELFFPS